MENSGWSTSSGCLSGCLSFSKHILRGTRETKGACKRRKSQKTLFIVNQPSLENYVPEMRMGKHSSDDASLESTRSLTTISLSRS